MTQRRPCLVLPSGQRYRPTPRQWQALCALAVLLHDKPATYPVWPRDLEPRVYEGAQLQRRWLALVAKGALERTPQGYRLLPSIRDQILAQAS